MLITTIAASLLVATSSTAFTLASGTFADWANLPLSAAYSGYGCTGQNLAPEIHWSGVPAGTKSFALTMYDPDAAGGWWHWVVFDIPAATVSMPADKLDSGRPSAPHHDWVAGATSFDSVGYGGPCPPPGKPHHYVLTLYALDLAKLPDASARTTGPALLAAIQGHVLGKATLTGLYGRL